jgi:hypothetical protein
MAGAGNFKLIPYVNFQKLQHSGLVFFLPDCGIPVPIDTFVVK